MKKAVIIICILILMMPAMSFAQDIWRLEQGDRTFTLQGSGTSDDNIDNTILSVEASYGYLYTDSFEFGIRQGIGYIDVPGDDMWNGSTRVYMDFNFGTDRLQPFLGANAGYLYGDNVNETWIAGPQGGIKAFISSHAFFMALVEYNFTFEDADNVDEAFDDGRFVYSLGFGIRF